MEIFSTYFFEKKFVVITVEKRWRNYFSGTRLVVIRFNVFHRYFYRKQYGWNLCFRYQNPSNLSETWLQKSTSLVPEVKYTAGIISRYNWTSSKIAFRQNRKLIDLSHTSYSVQTKLQFSKHVYFSDKCDIACVTHIVLDELPCRMNTSPLCTVPAAIGTW